MAGVAELDGLPPKTAIARHRFPTLAGFGGSGGLHAIGRQNTASSAISRQGLS